MQIRAMAYAFLSLTFLSGCGAMRATEKMPAKMDETQREIESTNHKMDQTQKQIETTNDQLKKMRGTVDQQPVAISFEDLLKEELGRDLQPIPFDLIPFAKKFGEYASSDDIVDVVDLWIKKLNELVIEAESPTPEQIALFNHHKMQIFSALQAVCGLLPREKVRDILVAQVENDGAFKEAALAMLMLRVRFLRDVMLEARLFSLPLDNVGKLEKAIEYTDSIDEIARLPYANEVHLKVTGFMDPIPSIEESMDVNLALQTWQKIKTKAARSLKVVPKPVSGNPGVDQKLYGERQVRVEKALQKVNLFILSWGGKP